ncbi:acyl-CoA dehydrogenase C-terminal domain-containing protein [Salinimonas chungwhensis]|uniref:acyl-CoA dehydrogenase C-terminal domain-containing protein n=1 Tax=Salinimonas chungwhensis TaxID=265425 RepID=UPI000363358E|nr:acyl-CoA dehydrogenase C-terminal domain-containing protein [Salinimonas chungwhensis]
MENYRSPQRDAAFVAYELFDFQSHYDKLGLDEVTPDLVKAIHSEAAKFADNVLAPINQSGDQEGCHWSNGEVTTPAGFKEAYQQYVEGGWPSMSHPEKWGGQGLPYSLATSIAEYFSGANHSWAMYPGLSQGCISTLLAHGSDTLKAQYLPKLISGQWTGTMCLTEAHCGSDLGMLRCKAQPNEDGSYSLSGTKIFISAGEHDFADNIVHIVLARLPDAPAGTKGISLFVVPKYNVTDEGELADRNQVQCGSIEHKMGIKASATCVINFDGAKGYLIGEPNRGLNGMFTFMNIARIGTGLEGMAASEAALQGALRYAQDRTQFRSPTQRSGERAADPIIVHPDVRRMLLTQKAFAEGSRALAYYCMQQVDICQHSKTAEDIQLAESKLALLTPIVKAFFTETAQESTSHGIQIYGGHGYISEWGMEQLARDTRISSLYEGTTGIQSLDLLGRKILGSKGELLAIFLKEMSTFCSSVDDAGQAGGWRDQLLQAMENWQALTRHVGSHVGDNPDELGAASVDYLMFSGYVTLAYYWLKMALVAKEKLAAGTADSDFYQGKIETAKFYFSRLLPRADAHAAAIYAGADSVMGISESMFKTE